MLQEPVDCIDHECDERFAPALREQALDHAVRDTREPERIYQREGRGHSETVLVNAVQSLREVFREAVTLDGDPEVLRDRQVSKLLLQMINPILAFVHKPKRDLTFERPPVVDCDIERNQRGARLPARVPAGT